MNVPITVLFQRVRILALDCGTSPRDGNTPSTSQLVSEAQAVPMPDYVIVGSRHSVPRIKSSSGILGNIDMTFAAFLLRLWHKKELAHRHDFAACGAVRGGNLNLSKKIGAVNGSKYMNMNNINDLFGTFFSMHNLFMNARLPIFPTKQGGFCKNCGGDSSINLDWRRKLALVD